MKCEVQRLHNNVRFRILDINEERYILDMNQSIWKILFPFLTWITPNKIYKINKQATDKKLKFSKEDPMNNNTNTILTTGVAIIIANLLRPLADAFNIQSTPGINLTISLIVIMFVIILRIYLSSRNKRKFELLIKTDRDSKKFVWIRPNSFKQVFQCFLAYVFCLVFSIISFWAFIQLGNMIMLFIATLTLLIVSISNTLTVLDGITKVRFKMTG
ncbi:DUF443 family protein [Gracilibacillus lacisalsi]|uniref:DUF443 family protein n=1 Tax=Gracilibacillus lacisalsi TaxID=393087 RepID=UPI000382DAF4|nr:DUF443 family protein [Gracilibacillus lacisalsi]